MEEWVQQCVHQFLFLSGENCCWNVRNAASSFRRVLPKSMEDIWVVFLFQKWMPILEDEPCPGRPSTSHTEETVARVREIIHAGQHLTIREFAEDVGVAFGMCQKSSNWRIANETCVSEIFAPSPDGGAEGRSRVSLHWPQSASPK